MYPRPSARLPPAGGSPGVAEARDGRRAEGQEGQADAEGGDGDAEQGEEEPAVGRVRAPAAVGGGGLPGAGGAGRGQRREIGDGEQDRVEGVMSEVIVKWLWSRPEPTPDAWFPSTR